MPKTKLDIYTPRHRRETFNRVVKIAMAANDIETQEQLADMIGISRQSISRRFCGGGWRYEELCRLIRVLKIGPEGTAEMFGVNGHREAVS